MKKIRKLLFVIVLILLFACTGCLARSPEFNNLDTYSFYANMKPSLANYGKKTAAYNNRIYYLSTEYGTQGIYSMFLDGTDVRREFAAADIRSLTVDASGFYYSCFSHVGTNDNGEYRCFQLLHRDSATGAPIDLIGQAENTVQSDLENIWDFYLAEDGCLYFRTAQMDFYLGSMNLSASAIDQGRILTMPDYTIPLDNLSAIGDPQLDGGLVIYQRKNQMFPVSTYITTEADWATIYDDNVSLFDLAKQRTILPIDALFLSSYERGNGPYSDHWLLRYTNKGILLAYEAGLYEYAGISKTLCSFPKTESIYSTYDTGSDIFLMTKTFRKDGWIRKEFRKLFQIPTKKGENLYRFDPLTGGCSAILKLGDGEAFLFIDDDTVAAASGKEISIYDISNDKAELLRTIKVSHNIVDRANKVDTAGDWLFLYRFNEQTQRDELIEKVYIGS
ncbi:MAG: hypothetical protein BGN88_02800 [Clostridiales bacterium 43-6]|nr:MAG: hypothetical protein BGN88_02800 [Clostridiales bacterium 43-6]